MAVPRRVLDRACRSIGALLGPRRSPRSGWPLTRSAAIALLIMARSALGRLLTILAMIGLTAVLGYLAINVPAGTGFGNLPFVAIMVGADRHRRSSPPSPTRSPGRSTRRGSPSARPIVARRDRHARARRDGHARRPPRRSARPGSRRVRDARRWPRPSGSFLLGPIAWVAFAIAGRFGFGPLAPAPAPDEPAALLPPPSPPPSAAGSGRAPSSGCRSSGWWARCWSLPLAIYIASYIPWAFVENHQLYRGLAAGPHRPDAARPHRRDVRLPQRPDGAARGVVAVVGLAVRPEAGLVLPGEPRRQHDRRRSTTPATS